MNKEQLDAIRKRIKQSKSSNWVTYMVVNEDVPALIAEVERLQKQVATDFFKYGELTTAYEEVAEENAQLREALRFYADESNHTEPRGKNIFGDIFYDNGKKARQVLGGDEND